MLPAPHPNASFDLPAIDPSSPRSLLRTLIVAALGLALLAFSTGCNDDDCRERVDPVEREETQRERIVDLLDDAGVPEAARARVIGIYDAMKPERAKIRGQQEKVLTGMLRELLQPSPDRDRSRAYVTQLATHVTGYAHSAVDRALQTHALLSNDQRDAIADEVEDSKGSFPSNFMINRGVDYVLFKVDASTPQRVRILELKDAAMGEFETLRTKQGRERRFLLGQWRAASPDTSAVHASVDRASAQLTGFGHRIVDTYLTTLALLRPKQRIWLDARVESMRTCPAQPKR